MRRSQGGASNNKSTRSPFFFCVELPPLDPFRAHAGLEWIESSLNQALRHSHKLWKAKRSAPLVVEVRLGEGHNGQRTPARGVVLMRVLAKSCVAATWFL